jgi:hypothetical protein
MMSVADTDTSQQIYDLNYVFWVVAPCSLVEIYRRFRGACCHRNLKSHRFVVLLIEEVGSDITQLICTIQVPGLRLSWVP